jgi:hypothetical protein
MPGQFQEAVDSATKLQDVEDASANEVDYFFEVPLEVAKHLTGFKHDEGASGVTDDSFHKYVAVGKGAGTIAGRPWWRFWL